MAWYRFKYNAALIAKKSDQLIPNGLVELAGRVASAAILCRHAPQQTEKSGAKFKILKCSKQTLSPFPQQSTLYNLGYW
jgi:hypothetical protein